MAKQQSFTREELLECGHGNMFGPGNAQLPTPNMLMMDRVLRISDEGGAFGKGEIQAELDIHPDLWFFKCHFPGDPVPTASKVSYQLGMKRVISRKLVLGVADGAVKVDGREIYTAKDLRVGLFTNTDNF